MTRLSIPQVCVACEYVAMTVEQRDSHERFSPCLNPGEYPEPYSRDDQVRDEAELRNLYGPLGEPR